MPRAAPFGSKLTKVNMYSSPLLPNQKKVRNMEKILIVEDDEMVRCGIEDVLKMRDWNTETASTFAEGMKNKLFPGLENLRKMI